jgi:hypothetical protein
MRSGCWCRRLLITKWFNSLHHFLANHTTCCGTPVQQLTKFTWNALRLVVLPSCGWPRVVL